MSQSKPSILPVIAAAFFLAFGVTFLQPIRAIMQTLTSWYEPHPGTVTTLEVIEDEITSIEYSYMINGRKYFGEKISHCQRLNKSEIERATGQLKKDRPVTVYVDPKKPAKCVLIRGLTESCQFSLAWSIAALLGVVACIFQFWLRNRSKEDIKRRYEDQAEYQHGAKRLRLVPGGFKSPASVAVTCFVVCSVIFYVMLEINDRLLGWWDLSVGVKIGISVAIAMVGAVFDYFYTLRGNERGRWDLMVDEKRGSLQLPAIGAYGQPTTHKLQDVTGLQLKTLLRPEACDNNQGLYRLNLICEKRKLSRTHEVPYEAVTEHAVAQSHNRTELEALAEWLNEATGLSLEIEEAVSDGRLLTLLSELTTTSNSLDTASAARHIGSQPSR